MIFLLLIIFFLYPLTTGQRLMPYRNKPFENIVEKENAATQDFLYVIYRKKAKKKTRSTYN